jgi:hypothetical protein
MCTAELRIAPMAPLAIVVTGQSAQFNAPRAGLLQLLATVPHNARAAPAAAASRRPSARIAPVRKAIARSGPVTVKLKLNTAAKRLLRRKEKLAIRLRSTFTETGGRPVTETRRATLTPPPKKARSPRRPRRSRNE